MSFTFGRIVALSILFALSLPAFAAGTADEARIIASRERLQSAADALRQLPQPAPLPRELLLQRPRHFDLQLAPSGDRLSYRRREHGQTSLHVRELADGREQRLLAEADDLQVQWSDDGQRLWLADAVGLAVHEVGSAAPRRIHKWDRTRQQAFWSAASHAPPFALIRERIVEQGQRRYRYLRIDHRGDVALLHAGAQPLRGLLLHADGRIAFSAESEGEDFNTVIRRHSGASSEELHRCTFVEHCRLLAFADGGNTLTLLAPDTQGLLALQRWQADTGGLRVLHRPTQAGADAVDLMWSTRAQDWLAVAYHPDRRRWFGRDTETTARLAALQRQLPDCDLALSTGGNGRNWLVTASRSTWPEPRHYLYQVDDALRPLFDSAGATPPPPAQLSASLPISFRASDGMLLHGYVTLPQGVDVAQAPVIALLHGGPYNRDRGGYSALVQLLANRGHVVLQPNFRASTGYGLGYVRAAGGEFGDGRVLADILDALDFLLAAGIGNADKQALMGHSFGGYASLLGVSHRPQRFRVAVASAAPVDLGFSMRYMADEGGSGLPADGPAAERLLPQYGMPFADADWHARMRHESPLAQVAQLRTPLYLWAGARDDRVPLPDIARYVADARRHDQSPLLLVDPDSGHNPEARLSTEAVFWLYESAASRHLGGRLEPPSAPLQRFLDARLHGDPPRSSPPARMISRGNRKL